MGIEELLEELRNKTTVGNKVRFYERDSTRSYELGEVVDEVSVLADNLSYKYFIQKIRGFDGKTRIRVCYYNLNKKRTKIVFGQYAPSMDEADYRELFRKAQKKFEQQIL